MKKRNLKYTKLIIIFLALSMFVFSRHNPLNDSIYADTVTTDIILDSSDSVSDLEEQDLNYEESNDELEETSKPEKDTGLEEDQDHLSDEELSEDGAEKTVDESVNSEENEENLPEQTEKNSEIESRALKSNETFVSSYSDLKTKIENRSTYSQYDTFYFNQDITADSRGISVPNGFSFTIDGTNPETGERFSFKQYPSQSINSTILYNGSSMIGMRMRNIDIVGDNPYGVMSSLTDAYYVNVEITYQNVDYTGPRLGYFEKGTINLDNSNVKIEDGSVTESKSAFYAQNFILIGDNEVIINGQGALSEGANLFYAEAGSNLNVYTQGPLILRDTRYSMKSNVYIKSGSSVNMFKNESIPSFVKNYVIDVDSLTNEGSLNINTNDQSKTVVRTKSLTNTGIFYVNVSGNVSESQTQSVVEAEDIVNDETIDIKSDTKIKDIIVVKNPIKSRNTLKVDANIVLDDIIRQTDHFTTDIIEISGIMDVKVDYLGESIITGSMLEVFNLKARYEIGTHGTESLLPLDTHFISNHSNFDIIIKGKNAQKSEAIVKVQHNIHLNNTSFSLDNEFSDYKTIFEAGEWWFHFTDADLYGGLSIKDASIEPSLVISSNAWIMANQVNHWTSIPDKDGYPSGNNFGAEGHYIKNGNSYLSIMFSSNGKTTRVDNPGSTDADHTSEFKAHGQSAYGMGRMKFEVEKNEDDNKKLRAKTNAGSWVQIETDPLFNAYADDSGVVDADVPFNIKNRTYKITTFGGYLFDTKTIEYDVDGPLEFDKFPEKFDFGVIELEDGKKSYPRKNRDQLVVYDGRKNKTGWKLSVYIEQDLYAPEIENSTISKAFILDNASKRLSENPVLIYETDSLDYEDEYVIDWESDKGLQLYIENIYDLRLNKEYKARLVWVLEEK